VTSADDVDRSKPAPDIFADAVAKVAPISAAEAVAVGDTPYDALSAGKCRIGLVAVRSGGFSDLELSDAGAMAIYDDVEDLLARLEDWPLLIGGGNTSRRG